MFNMIQFFKKRKEAREIEEIKKINEQVQQKIITFINKVELEREVF